MPRLAEEGGALGGVVTELMAKDAKGTGGIAELLSDLSGGRLRGEEGPQGLVLALEGLLRREEKTGGFGSCYPIASTYIHESILLKKQIGVNTFLQNMSQRAKQRRAVSKGCFCGRALHRQKENGWRLLTTRYS
jgi:hypothetical protein